MSAFPQTARPSTANAGSHSAQAWARPRSAGRTRRRRLGSVALLGVACLTGLAWAAETDVAQPGRPQVVPLEYREVEQALINWSVSFEAPKAAFTREPDFGKRTVLRRALKLGNEASQAVSVAWDKTQGKLYLDLNRNLDLTDDTNGVFTAASRQYYQTFLNVRLPFKTDAGLRQVLVDLSLADYGMGPGGFAALQSYWQGTLNRGGQDWQVGLVEGRFGEGAPSHLMLRPAGRRNDRFSLQDGSVDAFDFPRHLFWEGQGYTVACQWERGAAGPRWRLELTPHAPVLGELRLTGANLGRVVLTGSEYTVLLDTPPPVVKVPVGKYDRQLVWLQRREATAYRNQNLPTAARTPFIVQAEAPVTLTAGGPLTNRVSLNRRGRTLVLSYELVGADGAVYQVGREDRTHPPEFAVYQGDKKISSGKFEFG